MIFWFLLFVILQTSSVVDVGAWVHMRERWRGTSSAPIQKQVGSHCNHPSNEPVQKCCYASSKTLNIYRKNLQWEMSKLRDATLKGRSWLSFSTILSTHVEDFPKEQVQAVKWLKWIHSNLITSKHPTSPSYFVKIIFSSQSSGLYSAV